jgi:DNA replication protein DnaC
MLSDATANTSHEIVCFDPENTEFSCPICGGLGVVKYNVPVEHPRFGKLFRCPNRPIQADVDHIERLKKLSNLDALTDKTLANFETTPHGYSPREQQSLSVALSAAQRFAQKPAGWLLLEGGYGTGKTHLAAGIGNARIVQGEMVVFITVPDLLDHLRQSYQPQGGESYDITFNRLRDVPLLILDDLGVENQSEWAKEKLFQLLNHRYTQRIPTVITTNSDLESLDPRISSRLHDGNLLTRVIMSAPDFRSLGRDKAHSPLSRLALYRHMTFNNFDFKTKLTQDEHDNLQKVGSIAFQYAQEPQGWLLLQGGFGTGKTHLAAAIANVRESQGEEVMFITVPDLMDYLRTTFDANTNVSFGSLFGSIREVPFLVLDDIGGESNKPWVQEKLFQLLDYRYVGQMPTVMTTAKPIDGLNERLASRLIDKRICRVVGITISTNYAQRLNR